MTDQKALPDLTLLRDPADIWPEPTDCPDWPYSTGGSLQGLPPTKEDAEAVLANHIAALHGKDATLRKPTKAETEDAISRYFSVIEPGVGSGKIARFTALGYAGLNRALSDSGGFASRIVESTHIRGWLRKLDAAEEQNKTLQAGRDERQLQGRLHRYKTICDSHVAELSELSEAEERHLQAKADMLAHARCVELRRTLRARHADAEAAAREMGVDAPELPELRHDSY